jgi:hypothetical protein
MSKYEPARLSERLFDACIAASMAASALFIAVWLLAQIWLWLVGTGILLGLGRLWWIRQRRW